MSKARDNLGWLLWSLALCVVTSLPSTATAADFVGAESCRTCHQAAFDAWKSSPHARAFRSLSAEQQKDTKCLQCHARDLAQGGDAGVSCETCHGAGQFYSAQYVMRDKELARATGLIATSAQDTKPCLQCHDSTSPSLKPFDPAQAMKAIDHWSKDKTSRAPKSAAACPRPEKPSAQAVAIPKHPSETFLGRTLRQATARGKAGSQVRVEVAASGPALASARPSSLPAKAD